MGGRGRVQQWGGEWAGFHARQEDGEPLVQTACGGHATVPPGVQAGLWETLPEAPWPILQPLGALGSELGPRGSEPCSPALRPDLLVSGSGYGLGLRPARATDLA